MVKCLRYKDVMEKQPLNKFKIKRRITMEVRTRKMDRKVINNQMKRSGLRQINKHDHSGPAKHQVTVEPSYFAKHWREYSSYDKK